MAQRAGKVVLVGAGPGDPGLLTLRGADYLRRADLVLYDYLVNPQLLELAGPQAECVCLGRHGSGPLMPLDQIVARLVDASRAGRLAVRLKAGDPTVFAHAGEETAGLLAAGVPLEIVPGITAALAAASYAGIPLTHREAASAVALVTGQQRAGAPPLDWAALARFPGTLAVYMGVTTADQWSAALLAAGKPADTPVAVLRHVSWPDQTECTTTLAEVADLVRRQRLRPPVIFLLGPVAAAARQAAWFTARPLFGQRILVTRPRHQAAALRDLLAEQGAEVLVQPVIEIGPPADWEPLDRALDQLRTIDWLVFSSANGVRAVLERLLHRGQDLRCLSNVKLAAVGSGTAEELLRFHLRADVVPAEFRGEALAASLAERARGRRFLLVRASRGREVLAESLRAAGGEVEQVVAYESRDVPRADPAIAAALAAGQVDWVTVTSSAIARSLDRLFGAALRQVKLASISPVTTATLAELGLVPAAQAAEYTMPGVVAAILAATADPRAAASNESTR